METNNQNQLRQDKVNFLFKVLFISTGVILFTALAFATIVMLNSNVVFKNFIFNFFKQIPVFGQMIHLYIKSLNFVDLNVIYNQLILPLLGLELIYYSFLIIVFEIVILIFTNKFKKNSKSYLSFFVILIIVSTLLLFKQVNLLIIPIAQGSALSSRNLFMSVLFLTQAISLLMIAYNYSKLGMFDLRDVIDVRMSNRLIKIASSVLITVLLLFSSILMIVNTQVDTIKNEISVDYVVDFKPTADGMVNIQLPDELIKTTSLFGVKLPKTIEGGQILSQFAVSEVNIGEVVSQFVLDFVDNIAYQFLIIPMTNALVTITLITVILIFNAQKKHIPFSNITIELSQLMLTLILTVIYIPKFGLLMSLFGSLILFASILNVYRAYKESNYPNILKQWLHKMTQN